MSKPLDISEDELFAFSAEVGADLYLGKLHADRDSRPSKEVRMDREDVSREEDVGRVRLGYVRPVGGL